MLFCLHNVLVTDICLSAVSHLVFEVRTEVKAHGVQNLLNFLNFCTLYVFSAKRDQTKNKFLCVSV